MHAYTHTHTTCSFLSINSTDHKNPPPESCDVGETQTGVQNRGTKTRAVQSNRRGTSRGRGGSRLARIRLAGNHTASASEDSSKSAYTRTHARMHARTRTHTYTHMTCSFLSNLTDHENPPPESCDVGETQADAQNHGTKTRAVQSNRRGTSRGRGESRVARTRLAGDHTASASDDGGKSAYKHTHTRIHTHTHAHTHTHTRLAHSCLLTQQTVRILLLNLVMWERHKQVCRIVAPRPELFSLTGEEPAVAGERPGLLIPD